MVIAYTFNPSTQDVSSRLVWTTEQVLGLLYKESLSQEKQTNKQKIYNIKEKIKRSNNPTFQTGHIL